MPESSQMGAWFLGGFAYNRIPKQSQLPEIVGSGRVIKRRALFSCF